MASSLIDRMKGAALLNVDTFEEVEHDADATLQAAAVVAMVAVASAIGASPLGAFGAIRGALAALVGWLIWAGITYLVGDKLFGGTATWGELLRTLGFAQAPGVLLVLGFLPARGVDAPHRRPHLDARGGVHRDPAGARLRQREDAGHGARGLALLHGAFGRFLGRDPSALT